MLPPPLHPHASPATPDSSRPLNETLAYDRHRLTFRQCSVGIVKFLFLDIRLRFHSCFIFLILSSTASRYRKREASGEGRTPGGSGAASRLPEASRIHTRTADDWSLKWTNSVDLPSLSREGGRPKVGRLTTDAPTECACVSASRVMEVSAPEDFLLTCSR